MGECPGQDGVPTGRGIRKDFPPHASQRWQKASNHNKAPWQNRTHSKSGKMAFLKLSSQTLGVDIFQGVRVHSFFSFKGIFCKAISWEFWPLPQEVWMVSSAQFNRKILYCLLIRYWIIQRTAFGNTHARFSRTHCSKLLSFLEFTMVFKYSTYLLHSYL